MREFFTLIGILLPLFLFGGFGWAYSVGEQAVPAYGVAAGVCFFFGSLAIFVQEIAFRFDNSLSGSLGSILIRTLGPIAVGLYVKKNLPELVEHRFFLAFIGCFLLTLTVEDYIVCASGKSLGGFTQSGRNTCERKANFQRVRFLRLSKGS